MPAQLVGNWQAFDPATGTRVDRVITLSVNTYWFHASGAMGPARAIGPDQIQFGPNDIGCGDWGTYTWHIADGNLSFTGGEEDQCSRSGVLPLYQWRPLT